jgi:hypothetical protein
VLFVLAGAIGAAVWIAFASRNPQRDAFDVAAYWNLGLVLCGLACVWLGARGSRSAWRWPYVLFGGQFVAAVTLRGGHPGNLFPLTLLLFAGLATLCLLPTYGGVGLRTLLDRRRASRRAEAERAAAFLAHAGDEGDPPPMR